MNFYPHHISDFNNATRHLTRVERSVYRDAIEHYYDTESVLTGDFDRLAKRLLCVTQEEKDALKSVLDEFFQQTEEGYFHVRCDFEIEKYRANISAKARAGIASAEARRNKAAKRKQNSTPVKNSSTPVHNQEPLTINQEREGSAKKPRFQPPSVDEIHQHMISMGLDNRKEAIKFHAHHDAGDWYLKNGKKMVKWKSAVTTWLANYERFNGVRA